MTVVSVYESIRDIELADIITFQNPEVRTTLNNTHYQLLV